MEELAGGEEGEGGAGFEDEREGEGIWGGIGKEHLAVEVEGLLVLAFFG